MGSTVRVGVIGCGGWGRNLVRNFADLGALVAVSDRDELRASQLATLHGVPAVGVDQLLSDPEIDAVVVATPPVTHAELAIAALRAGKHVFVEKPLALDVADAGRIVEAARSAQRVLMVGHLLQYHPAFLALKRLVDEGTLGRLLHLDSTRLNFGTIRREENSLWSFAPHDLSMILALVGAEPDRVGAVGSSFLNHDIADVTTTHLAFPGGQTALVHVSWLNPVKVQRLTVIGDRAMAVFDDSEPWTSKLRLYRHEVRWQAGTPTPHKAEAEVLPLEAQEPLALECAHFLACVANGMAPRTGGEEGLRVLRVLSAAQRAMADPLARAAVEVPGGVTVHPTATVDRGVRLGTGTRIWHYSHVLTGSDIGRDCTVGQNVMIGPDVRIGDGCKIQNNVSLYAGVTLEDRVFCGPSAVFTNVRTPRAGYDRREEFVPTLVRCGATIGANATIVCGNTLGANCTVGAGAVVTRDVADHALVVGNPARQIGWVSHAGERLSEDLVCPRTGDRYELRDDGLVRIAEGDLDAN